MKEYCVITLDMSDLNGVHKKLNLLAAMGWRLVAKLAEGYPNVSIVAMERDKLDE